MEQYASGVAVNNIDLKYAKKDASARNVACAFVLQP